MSAATHRSLARLPLEIFSGLQQQHYHTDQADDEDESLVSTVLSAEQLRREIAAKLKAAKIISAASRQQQAQQRPNQQFYESITTVGALLRLPPMALLRTLDPLLTMSECRELYRRICLHCAPKAVTALALLLQHTTTTATTNNTTSASPTFAFSAPMRNNYLPTGWSTLDGHLRGGLRLGTMTEVVGCAGTAKTQLALQMAVVTALSATASSSSISTSSSSSMQQQQPQGTIFIDTEQKVSLSRLREIAVSRIISAGGSASSSSSSSSSPGALQAVLENISVHAPANMEELLKVLDTLEEEILTRNEKARSSSSSNSSSNSTVGSVTFPVRLVVIDSIAAPARREFGSAATQAATVLQIAQTVKRLADQFQLAVFVINQVGSVMTTISNHDDDNQQTSSTTRAALGTAWHHCVSTRIELDQVDGVRHAVVVKSNLVGPSEPMPFQVNVKGVVELLSS